MKNQTLEQRWSQYFDPGFVPASESERWRSQLLRGGVVEAPPDPSPAAHLSGVVTVLERLGYVVDRTPASSADGRRGSYRVTNPEHRPTSEQFHAVRDRSWSKTKHRTNGAAAASVVPSQNGAAASLQAMLPALGDTLTVVVVGFEADGSPMMILSRSDGGRYTCTVARTDPRGR